MATFVQSTVWHEFHDDDDFDVPRLAVTAWGLHGSGAYDYNGNITGAAYVTEHLITLQGTPVDFAIFYKFDGGNCGEVGARAVMRQSRVYPVARSTRAGLCARVCRGPPVPRELAAGSSPVVRSAVAAAEAPAPLTRGARVSFAPSPVQVGYPCLVMAETGELKPNAEPFVLHARLLAVGGDRRLAADCYYCRCGASLAALSRARPLLPQWPIHPILTRRVISTAGASLAALSDDGSLGVLVAGADGGVAPPTQLLVANWGATCGEAESVLAVASVVVAEENVGGLAETQVAGYFSDSTFYESGDDSGAPYELPIEVDENNGYYSALLTLTCGSGGKTERADDSKDGPTALA